MDDEQKLTCLTSYLDEHPEWEREDHGVRDPHVHWRHESGPLFNLNPDRYVDLTHTSATIAMREDRPADEVHNDIVFGLETNERMSDDMNLTDAELEEYLDQSEEWSEDWMDNFSSKTVWLYRPDEEVSYLRSARLGEHPTLSALQSVAEAEGREVSCVLRDVVDATVDDWPSARWEDAIAEYLTGSDKWTHYPNADEEYWEGPYVGSHGNNPDNSPVVNWKDIQDQPIYGTVAYIGGAEGRDWRVVRRDVIDTFIDYQFDELEGEVDTYCDLELGKLYPEMDFSEARDLLFDYFYNSEKWEVVVAAGGSSQHRPTCFEVEGPRGGRINVDSVPDVQDVLESIAFMEDRRLLPLVGEVFGVTAAMMEEPVVGIPDGKLSPTDALRQYRRLKEAYEVLRAPEGQAPDVDQELRHTYRDEVLKPAAAELLGALGVESEQDVGLIDSAASYAFDGEEE